MVQYVYTSLGYLSQLKDNATGAVLWTANARDAEMHLTDQLAGNAVDTIQVFDPLTGLVQQIRASADGSDDGHTASFSYQFDKIGNLKNRADNYGSTEQFCYDALNRLTNYSVNGASCHAGGLVKSVAYDDIGNIINKSDLADGSGGTGTYTYANPTNPLPHAVKSISGTANGVTNPGFRYDANGNLTCEYTGPNCSHGAITKETDAYWSFNMAHTIAEGSTSLTLTYDSEHARVTQALTHRLDDHDDQLPERSHQRRHGREGRHRQHQHLERLPDGRRQADRGAHPAPRRRRAAQAGRRYSTSCSIISARWPWSPTGPARSPHARASTPGASSATRMGATTPPAPTV